jgi:hypothetical protein
VVGWMGDGGVFCGHGWSILPIHWSAKLPGVFLRRLSPYFDGSTLQMDENRQKLKMLLVVMVMEEEEEDGREGRRRWRGTRGSKHCARMAWQGYHVRLGKATGNSFRHACALRPWNQLVQRLHRILGCRWTVSEA